jgi:hypothetical protein
LKGEVPTLSHFLFWYILLNIGTMKEIKLTQGKVTLIDDEDYDYLSQWKWFAQKDGHTYYAKRNLRSKGVHTYPIMHRVIMNTPKGMEVDHIDHNGLNNQKSNLRNCTRSQNQMNVKPGGESKYLGVYYDKKGKYKYIRAMIRINNKNIYLGVFSTEIEAARVYDAVAKKYKGEFANLNFK